MEIEALPACDGLLDRLKLARISDLNVLESGAYWPRLQPYFVKPYFRRLTYQFAGGGARLGKRGDVLSTRGAAGLDGLDVAYVADRFSTTLTIADAGLPDYCLTSVSRGALEFRDGTRSATTVAVGEATGLVYRGLPGTQLCAADDHERLAVWIPASLLQHRLAALLGEPGKRELEFAPTFAWQSGPGGTIKRLLWLLTEELAAPHSFALSGPARQSFTDLLLYSLLQDLPHNHSDCLARAAAGAPVPRTVHRAEAFIRSHAAQPLALHEVAEAAGCSVRALQVGFRQFRDTTPTAAIRQARLEAVQQALRRGEVGEVTVGELAHRYGFTNPGRFTSLYRTTFGVSPAETLRRSSALR